ncbi:MAG: glycosyltransferase [Ginsengibacter sp.]
MYRFLYIAESQFDQEDAVNNRIINNVKAISQKVACDITIVGYGNTPTMVCDGIPIINLKKGTGIFQKIYNYTFRGRLIRKFLYEQTVVPDLIIYYGSNFRYLFPIMEYSRKKKVKVICDIVEWYDPSHLPLGKFGPVSLDVLLGFKYLVPKTDGVIAISKYLERHFASKELPTLRVPVLIDSAQQSRKQADREMFDRKYLNLIYAGFPGKKDLVRNVIDAVEILSGEGKKIRLHILGPTPEELSNGFTSKYSDAIICYGRKPQKAVSDYLMAADFSVLLRPNKRYAEAGFPTKFVESMNAGLPVIANITSDLGCYMKAGFNGYIVEDCSVISLVNVLRFILTIDKEELKTMHENAYSTAVKNFDYSVFSNSLSGFIHKIIKK